jgi:hypothetical protein
MSTVRMSSYLKDEIIATFKKSFDKANPPLPDDPKYGDLIYNTHVAPSITAIQEVANRTLEGLCDPDNLFAKGNHIYLTAPIKRFKVKRPTLADGSISSQQEYQIESTLHEDQKIDIPLSTFRLMPVEVVSSYNHGHCYASAARFEIPRHKDANVEYVCACLEYNNELRAKQDLAVKHVQNLLGKFTTLNQALKAWPALAKLVDSDKISRVHVKQERKRKQELQKELADDLVVSGELNKTILAGALIGDKT